MHVTLPLPNKMVTNSPRKDVSKNADAIIMYVEGSVQREKKNSSSWSAVTDQVTLEVCNVTISSPCQVRYCRESRDGARHEPLQGSDSNPPVSSNETPFYQQGSSRPSWGVISDGGCCRLLRRWPAASPVPALSSATRWKEWSREQGAVNKIFTR